MANRLQSESSPYLRQHAENPVDWYPWGEEALTHARQQNKPILLSIGYSACHWCHVMEDECFENPEIARLMNERFINIKVDREERPDLDQIYQNVAQLMTRSGGWPLTVFLTPDLKPYFGGTYFPPEDRHGRPGFPRVLDALSQAYHQDRANVEENAQRLAQAISQLEGGPAPQDQENKRPTREALRKACDDMLAGFDWRNGGFGGAPKFPSTMNLTYLWRFGSATGFGMAAEAAALALTKMAQGGIYDQLGGGFHRYSVDERWGVPHFEKMLYDNALLLKLYAETLLSKELAPKDRALFSKVLIDTTSYVLREMHSPEGGFYSTQDADSEGHEGKFFVWTPHSLRQALRDENQARAFELRYGITDNGNFEGGQETVLYSARTVEEVARATAQTPEQIEALLERARQSLFEAREKRPRPHRDEKIIASWNGLMISGLSWAARALRDIGQGELAEQAFQSALGAMEFIRTKMTHGENRLWSVFKDGKARFNAYLDDYAFCALAALDLARLVEEKTELDSLVTQARTWVDVACKRFIDHEGGGFFFTSDDHETLIQRPKSIFDQAIPSGNAVLVECLLALSELESSLKYEEIADQCLSRFFPALEKVPLALGEMATASLLWLTGPITVSGHEAFKAAAHPHVFQKSPASPAREVIVCHRKTCAEPLTTAEDARAFAIKKTSLG